MLELLGTYLTSKVLAYFGGSILAFVAGYILKQIPNDKIKRVVGKFFYGLGVTITLGLSKYKYTKGFWNKAVEPYFIDLIDNVVGEAIKEFIRGLRSDN